MDKLNNKGKYEGYADFGGLASRYSVNTPTSYSEAWVFDDEGKKWAEINSATHSMNCTYLTKEVFDELFPDLPPLPPEAFTRKIEQE